MEHQPAPEHQPSPVPSLKRRRSSEEQTRPELPKSPRTHDRNSKESSPAPPTASASAENPQSESSQETISDDDRCPICHLLLCRPVTTRCNHTLCQSCMTRWAEVSLTSQMELLSPEDEPEVFSTASEPEVEARCPMCRTQTSASPNQRLADELRRRYRKTYAEREADERAAEANGYGSAVQTLTLYVGNKHRMVRPHPGSSNMHDWTFFVKPSRADLIQEIRVFLHPTFRPSRIILTRPPYEIRRLGWGYFTIVANIILKPGYSWISGTTDRAPDGRPKGMLQIEWTLDFAGFGGAGSMGRWRLKVNDCSEGEELEGAPGGGYERLARILGIEADTEESSEEEEGSAEDRDENSEDGGESDEDSWVIHDDDG